MSLKKTNRLSLPPLLKSVLTPLFPLLPSTKIFTDTNQYISSDYSTKALFICRVCSFCSAKVTINTEPSGLSHRLEHFRLISK